MIIVIPLMDKIKSAPDLLEDDRMRLMTANGLYMNEFPAMKLEPLRFPNTSLSPRRSIVFHDQAGLLAQASSLA
jgi:hypothetical protein